MAGQQPPRRMDAATVVGMLIAFGLVLAAIGQDLWLFLDFPSLLIVLGGTLGAALITYPLTHILGILAVMRKTFCTKLENPAEITLKFKEFATKVRREGILALEPMLKDVSDDFLRKGLQLTVDGLEPQIIQEIMETEIDYLEERHARGAEILLTLGALSPAMGMIGTVIGLVIMLKNMSNPESIGPAMAIALLTTFYGAVLANLVFNPMAGKLKTRSKEEILIKSMIIEGLMALASGENPRIVEDKLSSFLSPKQRAPRE